MGPLRGTHYIESDICDDFLDEHEYQIESSRQHIDSKQHKLKIVWRNVFLFAALHLAAIYGLHLFIFEAKWATWIFTWFIALIARLGITAGAHRLWSHKSYKANKPLKLLLIIFNNFAFQNDIIEWARDHRVHHKYSETDADPHNAKRGFFFAHMGWLLVRKHNEVKVKGARFDISDLTSDPMLMFQRRHYKLLTTCFCFVLPSLIPMLWQEQLYTAFYVSLFRYCYTLHITWCINSIAHLYGFRPYDKNINPRQNVFTAFFALGEGWHNYHHVFPFDYRTSEFPYTVNLTTVFIDFFVWIGWAWDTKTVSEETIEKKKLKSGE